MKGLYPVFFALVFVLAQACQTKPENVLPPGQMEQLLKDLHRVNGYISATPTSDSMRVVASRLYASVYHKHGTDSATFSRSLRHYSRKPDELNKMYERIQKDLEQEIEALSRKQRGGS